jgi:hypothetical protein
VVYSLGNALFDQASQEVTREGLALEATVDANGVKTARLIPLKIDEGDKGYAMRFADNASGQQVLGRIAAATTHNLIWKSLTGLPQDEPGFQVAYRRPLAGTGVAEADLGMGTPALVELNKARLTATTQNPDGDSETVWATEPDWKVTGYTVGDVDADGRSELVYSVWKRNLTWDRPESGGMTVDQEGGDVLPHIYIDGWRRNAMRPVWHGSPRPAPVVALAVAPIGEGGKPLLAALESSDPNTEKTPGRIQVWEWSGGFGFELAAEIPGTYVEMWSDGKILLFR